MKFNLLGNSVIVKSRPPHRGAWIEIIHSKGVNAKTLSPPAQGGVD